MNDFVATTCTQAPAKMMSDVIFGASLAPQQQQHRMHFS